MKACAVLTIMPLGLLFILRTLWLLSSNTFWLQQLFCFIIRTWGAYFALSIINFIVLFSFKRFFLLLFAPCLFWQKFSLCPSLLAKISFAGLAKIWFLLISVHRRPLHRNSFQLTPIPTPFLNSRVVSFCMTLNFQHMCFSTQIFPFI